MNDQANILTAKVQVKRNQTDSLLSNFYHWTNQMDFYRLIILVAMILIQGCITAPLFLWTMDLVSADSVFQMSVVTAASFTILVSLLSVQPMRRTIPVFLVATIVELAIILFNLLNL